MCIRDSVEAATSLGREAVAEGSAARTGTPFLSSRSAGAALISCGLTNSVGSRVELIDDEPRGVGAVDSGALTPVVSVLIDWQACAACAESTRMIAELAHRERWKLWDIEMNPLRTERSPSVAAN